MISITKRLWEHVCCYGSVAIPIGIASQWKRYLHELLAIFTDYLERQIFSAKFKGSMCKGGCWILLLSHARYASKSQVCIKVNRSFHHIGEIWWCCNVCCVPLRELGMQLYTVAGGSGPLAQLGAWPTYSSPNYGGTNLERFIPHR